MRIVLSVLFLTVRFGWSPAQAPDPRTISEKADSLFEIEQYDLAAARFKKAAAAFKQEKDWVHFLQSQDAERIALESAERWAAAEGMLLTSFRFNQDSLQGKFGYADITYGKQAAVRVTTASLAHARSNLEVLSKWNNAAPAKSYLTWFLQAGSELIHETVVDEITRLLRSHDLLTDSSNYEKKAAQYLKMLLSYSLDLHPPNNFRDPYLSKALSNRDSSLWYLFRSAQWRSEQGSLQADSLFLAYVTHWNVHQPLPGLYARLLGWHAEQSLDFDKAWSFYRDADLSSSELSDFLLRKAKAWSLGQIPALPVHPGDTVEAHRLVDSAVKMKKSGDDFSGAEKWRMAKLEFMKYNCWQRVYRCAVNATRDGLSNEFIGDASVQDLEFPLQLAGILYPPNSVSFGNASEEIGKLLLAHDENHRAFEVLRMTQRAFEASHAPETRLASVYLLIGKAGKALGDDELAIGYFYRSLSIGQKHPDQFQQMIAELHQHLASLYYETGDYAAATEHLAWLKKETHPSKADPLWAPRLQYLEGNILLAQERREEAATMLDEALRNLAPNKFQACFRAFEQVKRFGYSGRASRAFDKSISQVQDKVELRLKTLLSRAATVPPNDTTHQKFIQEIEAIEAIPPLLGYIDRHTLIRSLNMLGKEAIPVSGQAPRDSTTFFSEIMISWERYSRAIMLNTINRYNARDNSEAQLESPPLGLPGDPQVNSYQFGYLLLDSYLGRTELSMLCFHQTLDSAYLKAAQRYAIIGDSIINRSRSIFEHESAKLKLGEASSRVHELGIKSSMMLATRHAYEADVAFQLMERSKSNLLRESSREAEAKYYGDIPDSLLEREASLKLGLFESRRKLASAITEDTGQADSLRSKTFVLENSLQELSTYLAATYPTYARQKAQDNMTDLPMLREVLADNEALVEYFQGVDNLFIAIVRKNTPFTFLALPGDTLLSRYGKALRNSIQAQSGSGFIESSTWLYEKLFAEVEARLKGGLPVRKLVIIPDGILGYIPFEVLMPKAATNGQHPYLVRQYELRYAYSASMLTEKTLYDPGKSENALIAFAPVFMEDNPGPAVHQDRIFTQNQDANGRTRAFTADGKHIVPLPSTRTEVLGIAAISLKKGLTVHSLLATEAREENLKVETLGNYNYIHVATHGIINDNFPAASGLLFSTDSTSGEDGILHAGEIYALKINASLVVLSACETGLGKVVKGEGIIGLSRGWLFAGANRVLVSLWKVADESTAMFMINFYNHLFSGIPSSEALRKAKLEMMDSAGYGEPYFWAPFILIGKE